MELDEALRTTGAVREFRPDPVPRDVLWRVLDTARFAPSGGNAQGWQVVVVEDGEKRRRLRDLYLPGWYEYVALSAAGLRPWSPRADRRAEADARRNADDHRRVAASGPGGFAEHLDAAPVLLALFVDLGALAAVDRDLDRYTFAGGASVYPFAWNLLLAAREESLGGVITTMCIHEEPQVKALLGAPDHLALAAVIALGYPVRQPRRLKRAEVSTFARIDSLTGEPLEP
ncbi:MAG: nitroreductase family protein [Actinomycetota bacterium]|nr:nitroreductase family protein [Actinomycetota bacterium]